VNWDFVSLKKKKRRKERERERERPDELITFME
jgi:hypothetical protein